MAAGDAAAGSDLPVKKLLLIMTAAAASVSMLAVGVFGLTVHRAGSADSSRALSGMPHPLAPAASAASEPCASRRPAPPFMGVAVNTPIAAKVGSFAAIAQAHPALVEYFTAFGRPFSPYAAQQAASFGALPLIQIDPSHVSMASIAVGKWDRYLRQYAAAVKAFGCPVALSFGHEMNGWWYSWGEPGTAPEEFIAAWRHVHHIFSAARVRNVIWSWDPDHGGTLARKWWPGAAYVNWIGIDGYLDPGYTFREVFRRQLANIRSFTSKPVFLAETAAAPGPQQAAKIASLFAAIKQHRLMGLVWFDINRRYRWRVEGNPIATAAVRAGVRSLQR